MSEVPLFIPNINELLQGTDYDMALNEEVRQTNDFTVHPIEDPKRSFLIDHNREQPLELSATLQVTTTPCFDGDTTEGVDRILALQDALQALRASQSVDTSKLCKIYTGLRIYDNMAIRSLNYSRLPETPNTVEVHLDFIEFRFAISPRLAKETYPMHANNGERDSQNKPLVFKNDRPIVEATRIRGVPRFSFPLPNQETIIRTALRKLGVGRLGALNLLSGKVNLSATGIGGLF